MDTLNDLTGQTFGRVTVLGKAYYYKPSRVVVWRCRCSCGTEFLAFGHNLRSGRTQSCGCLKVERLRKRNNEKSYKGLDGATVREAGRPLQG